MGVVMIIIIGVRAVDAIIIIVFIKLLLLILHHRFIPFNGFLISLSLSSY